MSRRVVTRREYRPADLPTLTLPGSLPRLLDGHIGLTQNEDDVATVLSGDAPRIGRGLYSVGGRLYAHEALRLPLSRPEARFRVACWLAEGQKCPNRLHWMGWNAPGDNPAPDCPDCCRSASNRDSYLRPPAPLWWALSEPGPGSLPAWVGAAILHSSALRVAAGMEAVVQVDRCTIRPGAERDDFVCWSVERGNAVLLDGDVLTVETPS